MTTSRRVDTACPYCGVGCGMTLHVEGNEVVRVSGNKEHPANFGRLCTKGLSAHVPLRRSGRLETAFVRTQRGQDPVPTPLADAISAAARRLRGVLDEHGPDALAFYVSGQMSIEAQYLVNKLAKGFIGTRHVEANSRLCMASAASGYKLSLGADGPPGSYQDFEHADLFFVTGANMADCHPVLYLRMMDRVKAGAKLIVVDPRRTATADKASLFLQVAPGTDLALLNGLLHLLVRDGRIDDAFIREHTSGWDGMPAFLADYSPQKVAGITGIAEADLLKAAQWIGDAQNWMSLWTMGINQSTHGTWCTNAICNLHLATGAICRPGSGPFSLTGQPNAMGGREVGYMGAGLPGQRSLLVAEDRAFVEDLWRIPRGTLRADAGNGTIDLFGRMAAGEIKACWIVCTNPVATVPNRQTVLDGLRATDLVIAQDAFLDTETNRHADILLPGALWAEAEGVMVNSERNLTLMQRAVTPPGDALPDWQIVARVACEMGFAEAFGYASAEEVFDEIVRASNPATGYDLRGVSYAKLRATPLQWPCAPDAAADRNPVRYLNDGVSQPLKMRDDGSRPRFVFPTPDGRAVFFARPHAMPAELPDADFPFVLNTGRVQHQWHTMTKTGKVATLNRLNAAPFVELHPDDARSLGVGAGDGVEIRSRRGRAVLPAIVTDRVRAGACFAPMHWNDLFGDDLCINAVTHDATDPVSLQPELKFCAVALTRVAAAPQDGHDDNVDVSGDALTSRAEPPMSRLDALGALLQLPPSPPVLGDDERAYVSGFLHALRIGKPAGDGVPALPVSAPLQPATRLWLDGMFAGLYGRRAADGDALRISGNAAEAAAPAPQIVRARPKVALLWASQTGNVESLVDRYATRLMEAGFEMRTACMADCAVDTLGRSQYVLLLSSTFGDGDAPDNGRDFWAALSAASAPRIDGVRYAVLGLGDRSFDQFCAHARNLDERMNALGASRLVDRVDCDAEFGAAADGWLASVVASIAADDAARHAEPAAGALPAVLPGLVPTKARPAPVRLLSNQRLNRDGATKETRHVAFSIADAGLEYESGDALGVWPVNCPELVDELVGLAGVSADAPVRIEGVGEMRLADALSRHCEIARPMPDALALIASRTHDSALRELLVEERKADLKKWLWGQQLADVLHEFPVSLSAQELVGMLKRLQPRLYSIASSPSAHRGEVHLTVSTVRYSNGRRWRKGVASTFLADRALDADVPVFVQKSSHFRPPRAGDTPIVMIGPGTGVAPFRGFLHERGARGDAGRNWLFFGERHADTDFYYRDELDAMRAGGLLTRLDLAFSRDQGGKVYVQDRMREHGAELWAWLQDGAHLYVCGDASRMAKDVDAALKSIVAQHGAMSAERADEYVSGLAREKRYLRDVY
ncbi:sulfite reductase (NADPH) alpha subunit [Paraburkholderia caballeronis]|uniref:sulfite reductase subunit alpha n=1 Tax=Paraburkholderia caballeronis TaxID=416943 RepID=UPI001065D0F9|nr:sulfite reductase subunit alpha [Paraburkholderia caballeronis]TDV35713.1 sulfite reductase (NADPH) alpha subunit [Paraburkholderia caballeronis]